MNFNEKSYDELKDIKAEITEVMKGKKEEKKESDKAEKLAEQEALAEVGRAIAKVGAVVACTYKGEEVLGTIVKVSEKTVSAKLTDLEGNAIIGKGDKQVTTWKYYHQIFEIEA